MYGKRITVKGNYAWSYPFPVPENNCGEIPISDLPKSANYDLAYAAYRRGTNYLFERTSEFFGPVLELRSANSSSAYLPVSVPYYDEPFTVTGKLEKQYVEYSCGPKGPIFNKSAYLAVESVLGFASTANETSDQLITGLENNDTVSIISIQPVDQSGEPVSTFAKGTNGFAKVTLTSQSNQSALTTVDSIDSDLTSLGVGSIHTVLNQTVSEMTLSFFIPDTAANGTAKICVDVFSDWPEKGGFPLVVESCVPVQIGYTNQYTNITAVNETGSLSGNESNNVQFVLVKGQPYTLQNYEKTDQFGGIITHNETFCAPMMNNGLTISNNTDGTDFQGIDLNNLSNAPHTMYNDDGQRYTSQEADGVVTISPPHDRLETISIQNVTLSGYYNLAKNSKIVNCGVVYCTGQNCTPYLELPTINESDFVTYTKGFCTSHGPPGPLGICEGPGTRGGWSIHEYLPIRMQPSLSYSFKYYLLDDTGKYVHWLWQVKYEHP